MRLADGNTAYIGDTIVTRSNDRRLRLGANDWVKNGDRWTVHDVHRDGSLAVHHQRTGRPVSLPGDYVAAAAELGYASTIHGAQGITADTVHGLATGEETRQQLYTMLTRGSAANHLYLQVVGDGDPHDLLQPQNVRPPTATDILEDILTRDDAPVSATTTARDDASPTLRLGAAAARYLDALHVAAEHHLGQPAINRLEAGADRIVPGIANDPAWPTLRAHLILLAATSIDPFTALHVAASSRELDTADDRAAVLDWRLAEPATAGTGPLPWLPGIPQQLRDDPQWGAYLTARSELVTTLATAVRHQANSTSESPPPWWTPGRSVPTPDLLGDLAVWRAANTIPDNDHRLTGRAQPAKAQAIWQRNLKARVADTHAGTVAEWTALVHHLVPATRRDEYSPRLAEQLTELSDAGIDVNALLHFITGAPLPDDHAASALWWRITNHLTSTAVPAPRPDDAYTSTTAKVGAGLVASGGTGPNAVNRQLSAPEPDAASWAPLADRVDARLTSQPDWPALAMMLTSIRESGGDPRRLVRQAMVRGPLDSKPAQDLRYRLVALHQAPHAPYEEPKPKHRRTYPQENQLSSNGPDRTSPPRPRR